MKIMPEEAYHRQRMMKYRQRHKVVDTAIRFKNG